MNILFKLSVISAVAIATPVLAGNTSARHDYAASNDLCYAAVQQADTIALAGKPDFSAMQRLLEAACFDADGDTRQLADGLILEIQGTLTENIKSRVALYRIANQLFTACAKAEGSNAPACRILVGVTQKLIDAWAPGIPVGTPESRQPLADQSIRPTGGDLT